MKNNFSAPIRICLSGEDLDWLGFKCCCLAISEFTIVNLNSEENVYDGQFLKYVWNIILEEYELGKSNPPTLSVIRDAPVSRGLSSSTSLTIALIKACLSFLALPKPKDEKIAELAYLAEHKITQCGGMDQLTISCGGALLMKGTVNGLPSILEKAKWNKDWGILLIDSKQKKSTANHILAVKKQLERKNPFLKRYIEIVDKYALLAWDALLSQDIELFSEAINASHEAMQKYQKMSTSKIEYLRNIALNNGCKAVKLTGAGGGGCLFGIASLNEIYSVLNRLRNEYDKHNLTADLKVVKPCYNKISDA